MYRLAARYPCPLELGRPSFRIVCDRADYGLQCLSAKARNQTRRGLENCTVGRVVFADLESAGALRLNRETLQRQGRRIARFHDAYWRAYYAAAEAAPAMEAWGAFAGRDLAAYLIACRIEDCLNILVVRSHCEHLKAYPNNALVYTLTRQALARPETKQVSFGLESVQADLDALDHFKEGMGFVKRPIGQRIELHRFARPLAQGLLLRRLGRFAEARAEHESFRKLAGMLRWYHEQPRV